MIYLLLKDGKMHMSNSRCWLVSLTHWMCEGSVTKNGVWLLAAQKPIKRPGWWKGKFVLFQCWQLGREEGRADFCPKSPSPRPRPGWQPGGKCFYRWREGLHAERAQSALTVILKLVMWWFDQRHLVLSTVDLQFQGWFFPISLRPVLGVVAAFVMATVRLSCS